ncbi:MAG: oligopeptidase A [Acidiferrobacterales bacterium]
MTKVASEADNPLLDLGGLPRFTEVLPEHVEPALDAMLARNREEREHLLISGAPFSWDSFAQPMEDMEERLSRLWSPVSHLNAVMNSEPLRAAYNSCLPKLSDYQTELGQDERVYCAYKAIAADAAFADLTAAQRKIIEHTLRDFRLSGAELGAADKIRFRDIQQELSMLTSRFEENVLDATNGWELLITDAADLEGLPESARAAARQAAESESKPGWKFSLQGPSYVAFMTYSDRRELRRRVYEAYVTRASDRGPQAGNWDNGDVIVRLLALRAEEAHLLGYPDYASLSLATKMAKSADEVSAFLHGLAERSRPAAQRELAELRTFAFSEFGAQDLEAWDIPYYSEKLRQRRYAFCDEDLRPYFPVPQVIAGMFSVVKRLYGLDIRQTDNREVWHPDVRFYEIRDACGEVRGQFYMDLYPRPGKRGGAWMDDCISRKRTAAGVQVPVAYLVCNITTPVGDDPALLTHDEVTTLFHEFGHGLHHMLTRVDYVGVSGINGVPWDAVELPSQFMENWCWERQALDNLARHYQTGAPLPQTLYDKMIAAKNFESGMQMVRQLEFSLFDMRLHGGFDPAKGSVQGLLDEVRKEVAVVIPPEFSRFQNSFSHIFAGGYAAGYYSYKWAEVLSADAFSKFEENGVFDRKTGDEFLHDILEQGGVCEPMELFVKFRGREPKIDALLRHSGLAS